MTRGLSLLVFVVYLFAAPVLAQDSTTPDATKVDPALEGVEPATDAAKTDDEQQRDTKPVATVSPPADEIPKGKSPEVFVPSEDISEDLAVSFPVDI